MKKLLNIAASAAVWVALALYLAWAVQQCTRRERDTPARGIEVVVRDSARLKVITPLMVKGWIAAERLIPPNSAAREIPVKKIADLVRSRGFVKSADVYVDLDGVLHIELSQRKPIMRVNTYTGYNFYITEDHYVLPAQAHAAMWLPVVTGSYSPPFDRGYVGPVERDEKNVSESYRFLYNLINFVEFIRADDFWNAYIEQINITDPGVGVSDIDIYNPHVEIVPRAGNHLVTLGGLDDYRSKLDKLLVFYDKALKYEGWDAYKYIDLKYKNQIVCTK